MNTLEFEARKAELARAILNMENPNVIAHVWQSYQQALKNEADEQAPCKYSLDEVKNRLRQTEADAIAGRGLTTEEAMAQSEEWV